MAGAGDRGIINTGPRVRRWQGWQRDEESYLIIISLSRRERGCELGLEG